jgi:two-component system, NarL family, response regulator NreC
MEKIKVLLVDDHAIMRDGIRALLSLADDIEIVGEAGEGREAIEKAGQLSPDVVVMDIAMPGMDGLEATRRIVKHNPRSRVLILSQHDDKEYILSAIRAGSAGYIPKRALGSDLVSAIRSVNHGESFLYPSAAAALIKDYREQAQSGDSFDQLTAREREILKLIAEGHTSKEIGVMLFISVKTVMGHRTKIMEKLGLHNRTELIKYAMKKGLLALDV